MSSYFVNSLSCYSQSVGETGGSGGSRDCSREYQQPDSPYRAAYSAVNSPYPSYPHHHHHHNQSLASGAGSGQSGDFYGLNGAGSQRLCHPPVGSTGATSETRTSSLTGLGASGRASAGLSTSRASPPPAHISGSYPNSSRSAYSPSSGSEASSGSADMSSAIKGRQMSPPPAHTHRAQGAPTKLSPAHSKQPPPSGAGSGTIQNDSLASDSDKSTTNGPTSTAAGSPSGAQNPGSDSSTKGDGDNDSESGTNSGSNQPQIYPWMRRMHLGHGKYTIYYRTSNSNRFYYQAY